MISVVKMFGSSLVRSGSWNIWREPNFDHCF